MRITFSTVIMILVVAFLPKAFAVPANVFISHSVYKALSEKPTTAVLVFMKEQADLKAAEKILDRTQRLQFVYDQLRTTALATQGNFLRTLMEERFEFQKFYLVNAIAVENVTSAQLRKWSERSDISYIVLNAQSKFIEVATRPKTAMSAIDPNEIADNIKAINADKVWAQGFLGQGIVIAGQDSGYKWDHPALKTQYRGYSPFLVRHDYNWHDAIHKSINSARQPCGYKLEAPCDDTGHGTHTMGSMLGYDYASLTNRIGVAPEARWIGCRNMDQGVGRASTYLECFEYFLAPYPWRGNPQTDGEPTYAPHVINNSWACTTEEGCTGQEFIAAIENLKSAGIAVVASAGNDGSSCGSVGNAPGFYSGKLFSVAAFDHRENRIADFSSRGPSKWNGEIGPNISGPGEMIRSAVPSRDLYDYKSGTSMAGPHVAGVIALLWSAKPHLISQVEQTMKIIEKSALAKTSSQTCGRYKGTDIPNAVFGYGLIDAEKAVATEN